VGLASGLVAPPTLVFVGEAPVMSSMPRVLTVTNMYPVADQPAYGSFVASQVESLRQLGLETDVIFVDGRNSRLTYARSIETVRTALAKNRYDLIHAHYGLSGWVGRFQRNVPLVVSFCGDDLLGTPRKPLLFGGLNRRLPRTPMSLAIVGASHVLETLAQGIIVKSEEMRQRLLPWSRERAHVIPNGVDLSRMRLIPQDAARRELGLSPHRRYVLFPHTAYNIRKRLDLAEAAIAQLGATRGDVELLAVYHQPPERMPLYYAAANALLLTSEWEGSPNVVKEALACALPVVSVPTGDVVERLAGRESCAVCPRDPIALAAALDRVIDLPRSEQLRDAVRGLDTASIAKRVLAVYEQVLTTAR
jgi:glycosyltransferase involved in cell wall biosynthesis